MKYLEVMEEDVVQSLGLPSVGPGSKGKDFPMGELLLLVREKGVECFSFWVEVNGYGEERRRHT
jgi:hypothetical protein